MVPNLFGLPDTVTTGMLDIPLWDYVYRGLVGNLQQCTDYYRTTAVEVDSSHILIRLLQSIGMGFNQPVNKFYNYLNIRGLRVAVTCRMTTPLSRGEIFNGVFYGKGTSEILIGHDEEFDAEQAEKNWVNLQPIRVLQHPFSDLGLRVPDGHSPSVESGLAVIAINVPMLAVQYRAFMQREIWRSNATGENPKSPMWFLACYPLVNMLASHLDCAIFNRLYNRLSGIPLGECVKKHPFYLTDYSDRLNQIQDLQLSRLQQRNQDFNSVLSSIPLVSATTLMDFAQLPDMPPTRQVIWGLILSRLKILSLAARLSDKNTRTLNSVQINQIQRLFRLYNADKIFQSALPPDLYYDVRQDMQEIIDDLLI